MREPDTSSWHLLLLLLKLLEPVHLQLLLPQLSHLLLLLLLGACLTCHHQKAIQYAWRSS